MQPRILIPQQPKIFLFNIVPLYRPGLQTVYEFGRSEGYINGQYKAAYTIPNLACRIKQNTLYKGMEGVAGAGLSGNLDDFKVFASDLGDANFATINWVNPATFQAVNVGASYTNKAGFASNGSSTYVRSGFVPTSSVRYTLNTAGCGAWINTESISTAGIDIGVLSSSRFTQLFSRRSDNTINWASNTVSGTVVAGPGASLGLWHIARTSSTSASLYRNGVLIQTFGMNANTPLHPIEFYIGGRNNAGVLDSPVARQYSMWWAGGTLAGQEAAFYTAWNAYRSSL